MKNEPFMNHIVLRRARRADIVVLFLLIIFLTAGCNIGRRSAPVVDEFALPAMQTPVLERTLYTVARGEVQETVEFEAQVSLNIDQDLFFNTAGRIRTIHVENGDAVQEGDLIAELDTRDLDFDLRQAQLNYDLAQERLTDARTAADFSRREAELNLAVAQLQLEAYEERGAPQEQEVEIRKRQVEEAELALERLDADLSVGSATDVRRLETDVALAELTLERSAAKLSDAQIVAPMDGEIQFYPELEAGRGIAAYATVARVVDPTSMAITANLVREDMLKLQEGMPVSISLPDSSLVLAGVIQSLPQPFGTGVDAATVIALQDANDADLLRIGSSVNVAAVLQTKENALWLPGNAVRGFGNSRFVLVQEVSGSTTEVPVTVGVSNGEQTEIVEGLLEGMQIVGQ